MYDKQVVETLKQFTEPYPFMRGLIYRSWIQTS